MLILNATDLDRSREYGQESIIYSLEGSSQFRIGARSGEPRALIFCTSGDPGPASGSGPPPFHRKPVFHRKPALSTWLHP